MRVGDVDVPILFRAGALRFNPFVILNCSLPGSVRGNPAGKLIGHGPNHQGAGPTNEEARVRFTCAWFVT